MTIALGCEPVAVDLSFVLKRQIDPHTTKHEEERSRSVRCIRVATAADPCASAGSLSICSNDPVLDAATSRNRPPL